MTEPRSVLFACNHNAVRSPMAAALLVQATAGRVRTASCGVLAAEALDPFAWAVMAEAGLDLGAHAPTSFEAAGGEWDLVVALTPEAERRAGAMGGVSHETWPVEDPTLAEGSREQRLEAYRAVREDLRRRIAARFP
ncbi:MAG: hypothetical protein M3M95_07365 [Pseudomonadota bacterium]|nr:hypothetical protein [Pseudomonadota bacterium]